MVTSRTVLCFGLGSCLLAAASRGQAPPLSCTANAALPRLVRDLGVAELAGDVVISCTGGTPTPAGVNVPQVNIDVLAETSGGAPLNVTSRVLASSLTWTEAMLFVDEPAPSGMRLCGSANAPEANPGNALPVPRGVCARVEGTGTGVGTYDIATPTTPDTDFYRVNAFQGRRFAVSPGVFPVRFPGVPFDPPGNGTRTLRITNVRINASQLGVPSGMQAAVRLAVSTNGTDLANPITLPLSNASPTAAVAQRLLELEVLDARTFLQTLDVNPGWVVGSFPAPNLAMTLRFAEVITDSLLQRNAAPSSSDTPIAQDVLGTSYLTEGGFFRDVPDADDWPEELTAASQASGFARGRVSGTADGTLGLASHGARLIARFTSVPAGVRLFVENAPALEPSGGGAPSGGLQLVLADANCAGPFAAAPANVQGFSEVALSGGAGTACWEVLTSETFLLEQAPIRVVAAYEHDLAGGLPALGTAGVAGGFAPLSTSSVGGDATVPIPRFVDVGVPAELFVVVSSASQIPAASPGALLTLALLLGAAAWRSLRRTS